MRMRTLWGWAAISLGLSGCTLANLTPQARFSEAAYTLNDASRWGQVDLALQHVSPRYVAKFSDRHRKWGEGVSIAEVDLVRMQVAPDKQSATSEISLSWFDDGGVMIKSSTITQKWVTETGKFKLLDESVRRGDPSVFAEPTPSPSKGS
jgi:hypothetical protein